MRIHRFIPGADDTCLQIVNQLLVVPYKFIFVYIFNKIEDVCFGNCTSKSRAACTANIIINGVTAAEIASFEGIAQQNVSKSIASAKKKLKKFLKNRV